MHNASREIVKMDLVLKHSRMVPDIWGHLFRETDKVSAFVFGRMVLVNLVNGNWINQRVWVFLSMRSP
jgi:hypothetical protein